MTIALTHLETREATDDDPLLFLDVLCASAHFRVPSGVLLITSARRRNECPGPRRAVKWKGENR
jgi:hypothetical protein